MIKKEILDALARQEDRLIVARALDKAEQAERSWGTANTDFLDPYQQKIAEGILKKSTRIGFCFFGGYEEAERKAAFFSNGSIISEDVLDAVRKDEHTLTAFRIENTSKAHLLTHRDYLGSFIGLGIKREKIGDILLRDNYCQCIILNEVASVVRFGLDKVGCCRVRIEEMPIDRIEPILPSFKESISSIASLRLDNVLTAGMNLSRGDAVEMIEKGKVYINWGMETRSAKSVAEGDLISVRGKGRFLLEKVEGETRKGRLKVKLKRYV